MSPDRHFRPFNARFDLAERWPEWTVHLTSLHGINEVIDVPRKVILITVDQNGEDWAIAHATAHLDLGHHTESPGGCFTTQQELDADDFARLQLGIIANDGRVWTRT